MSFTFNSMKPIVLCLIGMMTAGLWFSSSCLAADNGLSRQIVRNSGVTIRPIKTYAESSAPDANIRPENVFDVVGTLYAIDGNQITIGNRRLTLGRDVSTSGVSELNEVGVKLNQNDEVIVLELVSSNPH